MTHFDEVIILTRDYLINHKRNFFNLVIADILRAIRGGSLTGAFILTLCSIDYLAWIQSGKSPRKKGRAKDIGKKYKDWISQNLRPVNPNYTEDISDNMWAIRNSLLHTYGPNDSDVDFVLNYKASIIHLKKYGNTLHLNLPDFVAEVIVGSSIYWDALIEFLAGMSDKNIEELQKKIEHYEKIVAQLRIMNAIPPQTYQEMDLALAPLDAAGPLALESIRHELLQIHTLQ